MTAFRRHPARTANTKAPAAAVSARVPAWPPPIDSYGGEPAPALPSSPPGLPRLARRAAVIRNRGEHDLEGQATAAPGARRPVIAQDPLSPFSRRRSASARRAASATQGTHAQRLKARPWIQNDAPMLVNGFGWHFLVSFLVLDWNGNRAGIAGLRTRQGRAARWGGQALMRSRASRSGGARGRPTNRSKASRDAAAD